MSKLLAALCMGGGVLCAQQLPWQVTPSPGSGTRPVQYTYPEQVALTVGKPQEVDLHFSIRQGLHINSHRPSDASFLRTELIVAEPNGIDVKNVVFPPGEPYTSKAFPGHTLSVYTGQLTLRADIVASRRGERMLPAALRYQACDVNTCMPPREAQIALDLVAR